MNPQAKKKGGSVKKMAMGGLGSMGSGQMSGMPRSSGPMQQQPPAGASTMMPGGFARNSLFPPSSGGMGAASPIKGVGSMGGGPLAEPIHSQYGGGPVNPMQQPMDGMNRPPMGGGMMGRPNMGGMQGGQSGGMRAMAKGGAVKDSKMPKNMSDFFAKKSGKKFGSKMKPPGMKKGDSGLPAIGPMPPKDGASMLPSMGGGMKPPGMKKGGMACGGSMKKYAEGGAVKKPYIPSAGDLNEKSGGDQEMKMREDIAAKNRMRGSGRGPLSRNAMKDKPFGYARGGGIESKGKGAGTMVKMASGGSVSARADGIASKGKTNCKVC